MQFTKPVIAFASLVIFASTFLPRHWWHTCHHDHASEMHSSHAHDEEATLRPEDCPICSVVIPWYTATALVVFDRGNLQFTAQWTMPVFDAPGSEDLATWSGRAPPVVG